jgi:predicted LPLAT superfamily acyltransferase
MSKFCFIIPCYQHSSTLDKILQDLARFHFKVFVVNDGSDAYQRQQLETICKAYGFVELLHHSVNLGKGAACSTGLTTAYEQGFTHGIQIDSDGQHDLGKISELLDLSRKYPEDLISGRPVYDESVPKSRLYGRYATHIWVWIETLSFDLKDSMCGFRSYPLAMTVAILKNHRIGQRMDFDTEIMVRLYWSGLNVHFLPVPVIYPEGGLSHFDVWKDNVRISKMHTRLFFCMLPRIPRLILRKAQTPVADQPWHKIEEMGTILGIKTLLLFYKLTGRRFLNIALVPVVFYYSLVGKRAKIASRHFHDRVQAYTNHSAKSFSTFQHVLSFASTIVDKFAVWFGDIRYSDLAEEDVAGLLKIAKSEKGAFFITSHYGNIEVCRALGRFSKVRFNALVYYENAQKINSLLSRLNPESNLSLVSVKDVGPDLAISLQEKVDNKEWIFVMGDRNSIHDSKRKVAIDFLGAKAEIPQGPFIMAYLLEVPVYVIHCFREGKRFRLRLKSIGSDLEHSRANRPQIIETMARQYGAELEDIVIRDPLQWYNFFNFWGTKS